MKLTIPSNQINQTIIILMRRAGYTYIRDRHTGRDSYVRRLNSTHYPRFHCYIFEQGGQTTFNLHLDQRRTRYEGVKAHAGEYDGALVTEELDRLETIIQQQSAQSDMFGDHSFTKVVQKKKKSWWPF